MKRLQVNMFLSWFSAIFILTGFILIVHTVKAYSEDYPNEVMHNTTIRPADHGISPEPRVKVDRHVLDESDYKQDPSVLISTAQARHPMAMPEPVKVPVIQKPKAISDKQEMVVTSVVDDGRVEY